MLWKRLGRRRWVQTALGTLAAGYLRLVNRTNRLTFEPDDAYDRFSPHMPVILAMWHGQHFLIPFIRRPQDRAKVMVSWHRDGQLNAIVAEKLGVGVIRGSGATQGEFMRKGGVAAFAGMLDALADGSNVAMTADVPKVSRVAGLGIVKLAQMSGRPIVPVATATSRRIELDNWDRTAVNLPFGRRSVVAMPLIYVPADAGESQLEAARLEVQESLNEATRRAYEMVDSPGRSVARD
jgi:lysophospholipid acyltransferase (LPLAT)-like uncharacterized protein